MLVQHVTPSTIHETQDQLLLAGSKLTFSDIYNKEMDIPLVKGRYYRADDVDNTFILLNGVLTDIGQQAFRKNKQMVELQEEVTNLRREVESFTSYQEELQALKQQLAQREQDIQKLALAMKQKAAYYEHHTSELEKENDEMGDLIERLVHKIEELENHRKDVI